MKLVTEQDIIHWLSYTEILSEVKTTYLSHWDNPEYNFHRNRIRFPDGVYHFMSGFSQKFNLVGTKCYLTQKSKEPVFVLIVLDVSKPENVYFFEADFIGRLRTAASTVTAINQFAPDCETITLIGAGRQGSMHYNFLSELDNLKHVIIYSKTADKADALAQNNHHRKFKTSVSYSLDDAVSKSEVIILTTYSHDPIIHTTHITDRLKLICAIGANYPSRSEVSSQVFKLANLVVTDDIESAKTEGADIGKAVEDLVIQWKDIYTLGECIAKNIQGSNLTIFKSYGTAGLDIAVAGKYLSVKELAR